MLPPGTRLGIYEVTAQIGEGGMGQVYRATDTKLKRQVAIKILPPALAADSDRLARFQREAEVLASLNHPHIAAIYGIEESQDVRALVMELVEGEDLSQRIARGAIPLDETLSITKQVADALEAAHEQGIIHRDLKPANIKVRADGTVKVLDFGLAKAMEPTGVASSTVSGSPTITTPAMTQAGMILGTAAYMSPEQARGKVVDKRADIWAFGCVLYELLTGRRAFAGEDVSDTMAAVLKDTPNLDRVPAATPPTIRRLIQRCLEKDPRRRLRDIGDARHEIEDVLSGANLPAGGPAAGHRETHRLRAPWSFAAIALFLALIASAALTWNVWRAPHAETALRVTRFMIAPSGTAAISVDGNDRDLAITPDGTRVVYVGNNGTQLFVRPMEQLDPTAIATGEGLRAVFVAPNGLRVGFVDTTATLKTVSISGGRAETVVQMDGASRGATWAPDDTIIFGTGAITTGLQRVSAAGGAVTVLTRPDRARGEGDHLWPEMLPGGGAVLFTITATTGGFDASQVAVLDLKTDKYTVLVPGGNHAHYLVSGLGSPKGVDREGGHLVYTAGGVLRAVPFELAGLKTRGTPVDILPRRVTTRQGAGDFDVAADGTLVYVDASAVASLEAARTLVWMDRHGREEPIAVPPRAYTFARLSPDGTRVAVAIADQENDIWVFDLARPERLTRLTTDPAADTWPVWTTDGKHLIFASARRGSLNVYMQAADGTGVAEPLTESMNQQHPTGVSPGSREVIFQEVTSSMRRDLMMLALDRTRRVQPILQTPSEERNGLVSPDGHWLVYESNASGRFEIYVRPFPNASASFEQLSTTGGSRPLWARSGHEVFFIAPDGSLLAVRVDPRGGTWSAGPPTKLIDGRYFAAGGVSELGRRYDEAADGRFLMIKNLGGDSATGPQIAVVQNWFEDLRRLAPAK